MASEDKIYELAYLLTPLLPAEKIGEAVTRLFKEPIVAAGGEVGGEDSPRIINLAYPVKKRQEGKKVFYREAHFGALRFRAPPEALPRLLPSWLAAAECLRLLVTVRPPESKPQSLRRQHRLASKPPIGSPRGAAAPPRPAETALRPAFDQEAFDREIEGLLEPTARDVSR